MIDWLKYLPLQFRTGPLGENETFKGPSFSRAKPITLKVGGNTIRLCAPRHRTVKDRRQFYNDVGADLGYGFRSVDDAARCWEYNQLFYRSWTFFREWFGGGVGELSISVDVLARDEGKQFKGLSFFYPRVFEYAVANYLNSTYGVPIKPGAEFTKFAPINWQTHNHLPVFSCSFDLVNANRLDTQFFLFPLTDRHIVTIEFHYLVRNSRILEESEELVRQIIDSVQLELSPSSEAEVERVKSDIGELSLTDEFAPLKWPVEVEDIERTPPPAPMLSRV